ncbi:MAG: protease inhibitor I42 family protein [bacterium]
MKRKVNVRKFFIVVFSMVFVCAFLSRPTSAQREPIIREAEAMITHNAEAGERGLVAIPTLYTTVEEIHVVAAPVKEERPLTPPDTTVIGIDSKVIGTEQDTPVIIPRPTVTLPPIEPYNSAVIGGEPLVIAPNPFVASTTTASPWNLAGHTQYDPSIAFSTSISTNDFFKFSNFNNYNFNRGVSVSTPFNFNFSAWHAPSFSFGNFSTGFQGFFPNNSYNFFNTFQNLTPFTPINNQNPVVQEPATISQGTLDPQAGDDNLTRGAAYVTHTDVLFLESYPVQVKLNVTGQLPTPCHELRAIVYEPDRQNRIHIELYSLVNPGIFCIQVMESFNVTLSVGNYTDGAYTIWINGENVNDFDLDNPYPNPVTAPQINEADWELNENNNGESIVLSEGETFSILLQSNITTGFQWVLNESKLEGDVITQVSSDYFTEPFNPDEPLVGAGGYEQFVFQATGEGTVIIELNYMRPWNQVIEDTFLVEVSVEPSTVLGGGYVGLANPASVYCEESGGTLEFRTNDLGTYGVCIFNDGTECEEWAFFRGECGQ